MYLLVLENKSQNPFKNESNIWLTEKSEDELESQENVINLDSETDSGTSDKANRNVDAAGAAIPIEASESIVILSDSDDNREDNADDDDSGGSQVTLLNANAPIFVHSSDSNSEEDEVQIINNT